MEFEFIIDAERYLTAQGFTFWKRCTKYGTDQTFCGWRKVNADGSWNLASLIVTEYFPNPETVNYTVQVILH